MAYYSLSNSLYSGVKKTPALTYHTWKQAWDAGLGAPYKFRLRGGLSLYLTVTILIKRQTFTPFLLIENKIIKRCKILVLNLQKDNFQSRILDCRWTVKLLISDLLFFIQVWILLAMFHAAGLLKQITQQNLVCLYAFKVRKSKKNL